MKRLALVWPVLAFCADLVAQANPEPGRGLQNQKSTVADEDLPGRLAASHIRMGKRMSDSQNGLITITGAISDDAGTRQAQLSIQSTGHMLYRENAGRALAFNASGFQKANGNPNQEDDALFESLFAHFPDSVFLQASNGGSFRRLGSHFRADGSSGGGYVGPYWTIFAFSPKQRADVPASKALQQDLFIAVDDLTDLVAEIRVVSESPGGLQRIPQVIQTQFLDWKQYGDQWFPGRIVRLVNGKQAVSFQVQQATVSATVAAQTFVP